MKALVTGANGFLGAWLTKRLIAEGYEVHILIRKNSDLTELGDAQVIKHLGDVTDKASLQKAFKGQDIIFHLAGVIAYRKIDQKLMEAVNVQGTQNVVDVCLELQIPQLLHLSSVVAIGASFTPQSLDETAVYNIGHLGLGYFDTKKQAEDIVIKAVKEKNLNAVCVNPSTIYGFGDAKKGSRKTQVKVARGSFKFYTNGGVNVVAVEDVINGILNAVKLGKRGERYILANQNFTIQQLFERIAFYGGVSAPNICMPNWLLQGIGITGDLLRSANITDIGLSQTNAYTATMYHWFSSQKAQSEIAFAPTSSEKAIENSVKWMKDNGYLE